MTAAPGHGWSRSDREDNAGQPQFRYPAVLVLMITAVVFLIGAPSDGWARALSITIEGAALVLAVATSRERESVRRRRAIILGLVLLVAVGLIALDVAPRWLVALIAAAVTIGVPVVLGRGLLRLLRTAGVTLNAVAGALAIYMSTGLIFSWIIGFVALVSSTPYFAQHASSTQGDKVYFSFTVLTTTGFGDFTPATAVGHALAVIEMLTGQIYLVTVIGLLIGNFAGRARRP
jgi:membrane-associated HD superfamily phosphohydrolase